MKAYRLEILIIDLDEIGRDSVIEEFKRARYANDRISPQIKSIEEKDIGEWSDDHPLNKRKTCDEEYRRLFAAQAPPSIKIQRLNHLIKRALVLRDEKGNHYYEMSGDKLAWKPQIEFGRYHSFYIAERKNEGLKFKNISKQEAKQIANYG